MSTPKQINTIIQILKNTTGGSTPTYWNSLGFNVNRFSPFCRLVPDTHPYAFNLPAEATIALLLKQKGARIGFRTIDSDNLWPIISSDYLKLSAKYAKLMEFLSWKKTLCLFYSENTK